MNRKYFLVHEEGLIDKMDKKYGSYNGIEGLHSKRTELLTRNPNSRNRLGIFLFEKGNKSVIINEKYGGFLIPDYYDVNIFLIGNNPKSLKKKLEDDLEIELTPLEDFP